jgi:hypothetical protein
VPELPAFYALILAHKFAVLIQWTKKHWHNKANGQPAEYPAEMALPFPWGMPEMVT